MGQKNPREEILPPLRYSSFLMKRSAFEKRKGMVKVVKILHLLKFTSAQLKKNCVPI